jgi:hypothetical protein
MTSTTDMLLQLTLKAKLQTESLVMLYYFKAKIGHVSSSMRDEKKQ